MMRSLVKYPLFLCLFFAVSCDTAYQTSTVQYKDYRISSKQPASNELSSMLKPYADSVNKSMNDVVAVAGITLEKKQPEGTLGNLLADAMMAKAKEKFNTPVDAVFMNSGGIRLPSIPQGNITRGKIFELSPFDNQIVLLKLNGKILQQFLDTTAIRGGWPTAGCTYQLKNKKAVNITIGGQPLNENAEYTIGMVDYVANGGDNCDMLKPIPQQSRGYLFRDAIIEYFADAQKQGKALVSKIENRVSYAE
ncbi:MAG TPA: 5'-nucleotidase [Ferruginibacter sp.]|nr:5'-nucleotidase [Ferruginibacter sp.]HPH89956.1 5'-nucleotidase [Ferruginibacter sp.]